MASKNQLLLLLGMLLLGAFFRFYQITEIPLGLYPDEAMNGNNALEALATAPPAGGFKIFYPENNGREGLFINLQAVSLAVFGNEAWALRVVSSLFGTLTILGIYLLTIELFKGYEIRKTYENTKTYLSYIRTNSYFVALLSSFFLATSYWHINFSRIGFRAIMVPFFATFGMYFLLKGLRRGKLWDMVWAGIFIGLGFHTYIAFRFMPFVIAMPIVWYGLRWWAQKRKPQMFQVASGRLLVGTFDKSKKDCTPCLIALFLLITFVTALPIGYYFLQNQQDFLGRASDVSIFSAEAPLKEFIKSNALTAAMFFVRGDCNWRHNFNCQPELHPLVALFFLIGTSFLISEVVRLRNTKKYETTKADFSYIPTNSYFVAITLFGWLFFMSLPATLTREGLPHALRSIGMIPPVMISSGFGAWWLYQKAMEWVRQKQATSPERMKQLERIKREITALSMLLLILIPIYTYWNYFVRWAYNPNTYFAFSTDLLHLGEYLNNLPQGTKKYVVVNLPGVEVRGVPMPAQTVMFATDTFGEERRQEKNIRYILPEQIGEVEPPEGGSTSKLIVVAFLNGEDRTLIAELQKKFPELKARVPGDFVLLQNF